MAFLEEYNRFAIASNKFCCRGVCVRRTSRGERSVRCSPSLRSRSVPLDQVQGVTMGHTSILCPCYPPYHRLPRIQGMRASYVKVDERKRELSSEDGSLSSTRVGYFAQYDSTRGKTKHWYTTQYVLLTVDVNRLLTRGF